jgi:hypothetical protein
MNFEITMMNKIKYKTLKYLNLRGISDFSINYFLRFFFLENTLFFLKNNYF